MKKAIADSGIQNVTIVENNDGPNATGADNSSFNHPPGFRIPQIEGAEECIHCYCKPCVTSELYRQTWWLENGLPPEVGNNSLRKRMYYKFWSMLFHRGLWCDERYLAKKPRQGAANFKREIMPDCVFTKVRGWYPNPDGEDYMGHKNL